MIHLGDITKIHGGTAPVVDAVIGGSPCQDLSIAGKQHCPTILEWVLKRICAQYERDATMASLFDGIGGFPLLWEQLNGKGSCLWASEIEEFPMAVTRKHFG